MEPREKAAQLPESPGVYLFKDAGGTVLYVGKARNLRSRVRSYFTESRWIDAKTGSLAREIADLETIVVGHEREALALEPNLIKKYRPKFNVLLRDDKTYPYIRFTAAEKYPRVYFTRRIKKDGSLYFGPYFPAGLARRILHFIHKDRKSTRLNSSHGYISYAVFCLKKKNARSPAPALLRPATGTHST